MSQGYTIVADFGKTHTKLTLWSKEGVCLAREVRANAMPDAAPYRALDVGGINNWLIETLSRFAMHPVAAIIPVSHGAAVAGIKGGALAFVPMDYEWDIPADAMAEYRAARDPFALTGSPAFPFGLNFGAQLHYLESLGGLKGVMLLPYAQYWAWLLSGVAVSEVTSLGCHSDLWNPSAGDFAPMAKARGWAQQFAPMVTAGDVIGTLRPELATQTGLSPHVRIHAGLHDSNAALVAARGFTAISDQEATVLSTGTWFVAMRSPQDLVDLSALPEARDCLANVDVNGNPVPSARFMGGREAELLGGVGGDLEEMHAVLETGAMVLPARVPGSGPFPDAQGQWINEPSDMATRKAAVALYLSLMADTLLDLIGAKKRILIEGRFAHSQAFTSALAALRLQDHIYTASDEADVSFGALRIVDPTLKPSAKLQKVAPLSIDLNAYRKTWIKNIEGKAT